MSYQIISATQYVQKFHKIRQLTRTKAESVIIVNSEIKIK